MSQADSNRRWRENNPEKVAVLNRNAQQRYLEKMRDLGYIRKTTWVHPDHPKTISERPECEICLHGVSRTSREWEGHCSYPVRVIVCKLSECVLDDEE